ncbi:hypothetical protein MFIFM68171_04638 [Madurella fahalii]|uniref:Anaphase-promoting complex subunit 13 n=1 Tax=Madurella fahalii TaxID=1157608 RepID=A0ABQ0G9I4_9PEZI
MDRPTGSSSSSSPEPPGASIPLSSSAGSTGPATTASQKPDPTKPPHSFARAPICPTMNKDASYTYIHMQRPRDADLFEDFCKDKLPADDIYVPPHLQPINPEDEDDVVPDQHAAFGIQKATQKVREPAWKDLGLGELMTRGPSTGSTPKGRAGGKRRGGPGSQYKGLPR